MVSSLKMDHTSPQLSAIQSLDNRLPKEKFEELVAIALAIVNNETEKQEFVTSNTTSRVKPGLLPLLRIIIGNELKWSDAVLEALKSDDVAVVKQALNANWFFKSSNPLINVECFVKNVVPYIALRTRLQLIKKLAHCLIGRPEKADEFFGVFADLYGVDQALPLIVACSEKYIYDAVLEHRIILPARILSKLYRRYPNLVVRYLRLGNEMCAANAEDRKLHKIQLWNYRNFLPVLLKHHSAEFVELHECLQNLQSLQNLHNLKIGSTRAEYLLKSNLDLLICKPKSYASLVPLKVVKNKLTPQQFETMIENLFKETERLAEVVNYLKYYPQDKQLDLLTEKYKKVYGKNLLEQGEAFNLIDIRKLLPADLKEKCGRFQIQRYSKESIAEYAHYLPPREAIPAMKEKISKPSNDYGRNHFLCKMVESCYIYDSKEDLLEVLKYYNARHKNEQPDIFSDFLNSVTNRFSIEKLDKEHWDVLREMMLRGIIKGDFFVVSNHHNTERLFEGALVYHLKQCKIDPKNSEYEIFLNKLVDTILVFHFKYNKKWKFIVKDSAVQRDCLVKFLTEIPKNYCAEWNGPIWKKDDKELLSTHLLRSIHDYNTTFFHHKSKKGKFPTMEVDGEDQQTKLFMKDYPWLVDVLLSLLKSEKFAEKRKHRKAFSGFRKCLREHDAQFYQKIIDDSDDFIYDVETNDALSVLKKNPCQILCKWESYLDDCRRKLSLGGRTARYFVASTKWHAEIPVKFVEKSLKEIEEKGSIFILGILLEGEAFSRVIQPYLPKDQNLDINSENAQKGYEFTKTLPKAMNFANPPVSLNVIASFCRGDFTQLAVQTLRSTAQRVPADRVLTFGKKLVDMPISVKKHGIRLIFQVSTKAEAREFLSQIWHTETNMSIRVVLANMIFDVFVRSSNEETWQLMKICLDGLSFDDLSVMTKLVNVQAVGKNYVVFYVEALFTKIDSFVINTDDGDAEDVNEKKINYLTDFVNQIDENTFALLPESLITHIITKYFFHYDIKVIKLYLLVDESKLKERVEAFDGIIRKEIVQLGKPDPKLPRFYPANCRLKEFFDRLCKQLIDLPNINIRTKIINCGLLLFSDHTTRLQLPHAYISLKMYHDYVQSTSGRKFGLKFGKTAKQIVNEFKSDAILIQIIKVVKGLFNTKRFEAHQWKLDVFEGLTESERRLGSIISIKMIDRFDINKYGVKYDKLIKVWKSIDDFSVQALLNHFISKITK